MEARGTGAPSASRLANMTAPAIAQAFEAYQDAFGSITRRSRGRFQRRDWHGAVADAVERLDLYGHVIGRLEREVREALGELVSDRLLWAGMKAVYSGNIAGREDRELGETFFNSLTRRIFATVGVDPNIEFVASDFEHPSRAPVGGVCRVYEGAPEPAGLVEAILRDSWFGAPYEDAPRDAGLAATRLVDHLLSLGLPSTGIDRVELVRAPFFRRKGAYLVGRVIAAGTAVPVALALVNTPDGVTVDAVLVDETDLSVLFSFTRSHFHVDVGPPHELVRFLKELMPGKRVAELYIAIGCHKHGKTQLYRDLLEYLAATDDRFELAPGTPGLVMVVFTIPGFDLVFKVIRDRFPATKPITRDEVTRNYRLVFRHDRAGRLVEAQEFEHLKFDRTRFAPDLVAELERHAGQTVAVQPGAVVVNHAYVERKVAPLDLYVQTANAADARAAVADFGQALKDLAATNIFPGDLLPKNFGLTRHGRVVGYDYDELGLLTDFRFRDVPVARTYDEELSDDAWFGAGPKDVFPEEFPRFVSLAGPLLEELSGRHSDLFDPAYWRDMQGRVRSNEIVDIFPYPPSRRLGRSPV
jgi:isocitrate dehydrogenase kinase/phosphatase